MDINDALYTSSIQLKELRSSTKNNEAFKKDGSKAKTSLPSTGRPRSHYHHQPSSQARSPSISPTETYPLEDIPISDGPHPPSAELEMDGDFNDFEGGGGGGGSTTLLDRRGRFRLWRKLKQASEARYQVIYNHMIERKSSIRKEIKQLKEEKEMEERRERERRYDSAPKFNDDSEGGIR